MTLRVRGGSDDLIEIDGDVTEEFNADEGYLVTNTGVLLHVAFTNGGWRIRKVLIAQEDVEIAHNTGAEEEDDTAFVRHNVDWVLFGVELARKEKP